MDTRESERTTPSGSAGHESRRRRIGRGPILPLKVAGPAPERPREVAEGEIVGVIVRALTIRSDGRGWLAELYRHDELEVDCWPRMAYVSMTLPGVTRGPHEHADQTDGFAFIGPSDFRLWLWDDRASSPTFGRRASYLVGASNPAAVWVPSGVVHAYRNVGDAPGLVFNAPNRLYAGWGRAEPVDEIRHEEADPGRFPMD